MILENVSHHQNPGVSFRQLHEFGALCDRQGKGLLNKNVLPCLQSLSGKSIVGPGRGRDGKSRGSSLENVGKAGRNANTRTQTGCRFTTLLIGVTHLRQRSQGEKIAGQVLAPVSAPNDTDSRLFLDPGYSCCRGFALGFHQ